MDDISNIRALVGLWPTRAKLAADLNDGFDAAGLPLMKVTVRQVNKWVERASIPAKYHKPVLDAALARGFEVSAELIMTLHAPKAECLGEALGQVEAGVSHG